MPSPSPLNPAAVPSRLRVGLALERRLIAPAAVGLLLMAALYAPAWVAGNLWVPSLALVALAGAVAIARRPGLLRLAPALVAYTAVYLLLAVIHLDALTASEVGRYLVRPAAAIAIAVLALSASSRRLALVVMAVAVLPQAAITGGQAAKNVLDLGRNSTVAVDTVTGTLGASEAGTVALVALLVLALVAGGSLTGVVRPLPAALMAVPLVLVSSFAAARVAVVILPCMAVALLVGSLIVRARRLPSRSILVWTAALLIAAPLTFGLTKAMYPDAYVGFLSSQTSEVLTSVPQEPATATPPGKGAAGDAQDAAPAAPKGMALLPGRLEQLRTAVELSTEGGLGVALFGRGMGATAFDQEITDAGKIPTAARTGGVWLGRVLTETGWLGLAAFAGLLLWMVAAGRQLWRDAAGRPWDRALALSLPAVAALTLIGAAYTTILDVRGYSAVFWPLIGITAAAVGSAGRRPR